MDSWKKKYVYDIDWSTNSRWAILCHIQNLYKIYVRMGSLESGIFTTKYILKSRKVVLKNR